MHLLAKSSVLSYRESFRLIQDPKSALQITSSYIEVSSQEVGADKYNISNQSNAQRRVGLLREMSLNMPRCLDVLLQRKAFLLVRQCLDDFWSLRTDYASFM